MYGLLILCPLFYGLAYAGAADGWLRRFATIAPGRRKKVASAVMLMRLIIRIILIMACDVASRPSSFGIYVGANRRYRAPPQADRCQDGHMNNSQRSVMSSRKEVQAKFIEDAVILDGNYEFGPHLKVTVHAEVPAQTAAGWSTETLQDAPIRLAIEHLQGMLNGRDGGAKE
jgi:hypothetical protein